jgi:hypothetical protein
VAADANDRRAAIGKIAVTGLAVAVFFAIGSSRYLQSYSPTLVMVDRYPPPPRYTHSPLTVLPSALKLPLKHAGDPLSRTRPDQFGRES